jgi:hypothetical protein
LSVLLQSLTAFHQIRSNSIPIPSGSPTPRGWRGGEWVDGVGVVRLTCTP